MSPRLVEVASWLFRVAASAIEQVEIPALMTAIADVSRWCWGWFRIGGAYVSINLIIIGLGVSCQSVWYSWCMFSVDHRGFFKLLAQLLI